MDVTGVKHPIEEMTNDSKVVEQVKRTIYLEPLEKLFNLARGYSLHSLLFGLACCAIEGLMCVQGPRFDISRFGYEAMRTSPRQSDVMVVAGTITKKMAPYMVRLYEQMPEPKWVIAVGNCAIAGDLLWIPIMWYRVPISFSRLMFTCPVVRPARMRLSRPL